MSQLNELYQKLISICKNNRCDEWSNEWMYDKNDKNHYDNKIKNHYLITYDELKGKIYRLSYQDADGVNFDIRLKDIKNKHRIDIKLSRCNLHHFWLFDDNDWQ